MLVENKSTLEACTVSFRGFSLFFDNETQRGQEMQLFLFILGKVHIKDFDIEALE